MLARELGPYGIRANSVSPGAVMSERVLAKSAAMPEAAKAGSQGETAEETPRPNTFWEAFHQSYRDKLGAMTLDEVLAYEATLTPALL